jgi:hypothetical protein
MFDDEIEYPKFDLIIIDEIESCLNQFSSNETFKKTTSKNVFEFLENVIKNSFLQNGKLICLDGDIDDRTYCFLDYFEQLSSNYKSLHVINDIVIRKLNFTITEDDDKFNTSIIDDLKNNKKIVLVSLSSGSCEQYKAMIESKYPNKTVKVYTSKTDDEMKENDLKNVKESWLCDVLIYSPTIESGVNFDVQDHFNKIYAIVCSKSTSPRGFFQMLNRCRKISDNNVMILNQSLKFYDTKNFYKYDEVKEGLIYENDIKINHIDVQIDNKIVKKLALTLYDQIYIHNRVESINKSHYFLDIFCQMAENKGHSVNFEIINKKKKVKVVNLNHEKLVNAENINFQSYNELKKKQECAKATEADKYEIEKHSLKILYGVDTINDDILKVSREQIQNFTYLVDESNIKDNNDNITKEHKRRTNLVTTLLSDLGFNNVFDQHTITVNEFQNKINNVVKNNKMFTEMKSTKALFNLEKKIKFDDDVTIKQFMGFMNTILNNYSMSIDRKRKREGKELIYVYFLAFENNIDEIMSYKLRKGNKINDKNKLLDQINVQNKIYSHLVDWTKEPVNIDINDPAYLAVFQ